MTVLQLLGNAFREVIEATLLVNIGAKLVYHLVYPHQLKQITSLQLQCVSTWCVGQMVPDEGVCFLTKAPAQHVTEAIHRISLVNAQVNALFWSTRWSTQIEIFG